MATLDKDTAIKTSEEALIEIYKRLRPGEPPTVDSAQTHAAQPCSLTPNGTTSPRVGRYKFNKKTGHAPNGLRGQKLSRPGDRPADRRSAGRRRRSADPGTGRRDGKEAGVYRGLSGCGRQEKSRSSPTIWSGFHDFVDCDEKELGIYEQVRFPVLRQADGRAAPSDDLLEAIRTSVDELIPKHIIVDDILASINYLNCLANGVGTCR